MVDPPDDDLALDLAAAGMRADLRDIPAFLAALAARLEDALGGAVTVERKRAGLLSSRKDVMAIRVKLGDVVRTLRRVDDGVVAEEGKVVRGIVLRTDEVTVDGWIQGVVAAAQQRAGASSEAYRALRDLVG